MSKIIIIVQDRIVQHIITDSQIEAMIIDHDIEGIDYNDISKITDINGDTFDCNIYSHPSIHVNDKLTNHYFKQRKY